MNYAKYILRLQTCAALVAVLLWNLSAAGEEAARTLPAPSATVVDTNGKVYQVSDFKAEYLAEGMWLKGFHPEKCETTLYVLLTTEDNRVETTDQLDLPFASIRKLTLSGATAPGAFLALFTGSDLTRVDLRDGTLVLFSPALAVWIDANGRKTKEIVLKQYALAASREDGLKLPLTEFRGRAKNSAGKEGKFSIPVSETSAVDFK
jgi:hypothetical protein